MFGFNSRASKRQCGVIVDIGSGSVGIAIVFSDADTVKPEVIWSHREYVPIKDVDTIEIPLKEISTSVVNAFLNLGSAGMKALHDHPDKLSVSTVQASISAPWTYTVTKSINYSDDHPFEVDSELLQELSDTAEKQAFTTVLENEMFKENQLEVIDNQTISTFINGYPIEHPESIKTRAVVLAHITAITQNKITQVLEDSQNKILPATTLSIHSSMYMYYDVMKHLNPDTSEACLVEVTSEATEIGIIRDGTLTHVTHTSFGTFSIAREIAHVCKIPKEEAYAYLKGTSLVHSKLSDAKLTEIDTLMNAYEEKLVSLFKGTGDILAIPKTLFLHTESLTEEFFAKHLLSAAKKATGMQHNIHPVTSLLFKEPITGDTPILLAAHYFHQKHVQKVEHDA